MSAMSLLKAKGFWSKAEDTQKESMESQALHAGKSTCMLGQDQDNVSEVNLLMVKDTTPSWCVMRECGLEPQQFNSFRAAVRLYNALTQSNSSTARKILHADM